jgi:hypothetical protein
VEVTEEALAVMFAVLGPQLDERQRRLLAGAQARALGRGGVAVVARVSGMSHSTVHLGIREIDQGPQPAGRVRRPGAGRPKATDRDPGLLGALDALVEPTARGDPESPLRWTCKSTRKLADELTAQGHRVSAKTVARLLAGMDYSLQATSKQVEGAQHPDRDGQFGYLNQQAREHLTDGQPVISVDTKKKEVVGNLANKGRQGQPKGDPVRGEVHDFPDPMVGKAIPPGSTTLAPMPAGSASAMTTTPPRSRSPPSAAGGSRSPSWPIPRRPDCWSLPMPGVQQLPQPAVEGRTRQAGRRDGSRDHGVPLPAQDLEVEPDRAPPVQPDLDELAGPPAGLPRGDRRPDRRDHHPHGPQGPR